MTIPQEIIFESQDHYDLFCALFPEKRDSAHLASTLLLSEQPEGMLSQSERCQILTQHLSEKEKKEADKLLVTLEQLRLSLILTHEQIDFCFSLLYPTPKNLRLKQLLHFYLDSPLKEDLTQSYWREIGRLKESPPSTSSRSKVFVKAKSSTYLFSEWAQSHQYIQGTESSLVEFWEIPGQIESEYASEGLPKIGPPPQILSLLGQEIASNLGSHPKQLIAFGGAPHALLFLESKLASLRVPFHSLFANREITTTSKPVIIAPLQAVPRLSDFSYWSYIDESFFAAKESLLLTEPELFALMNGGFSIPRLSTDRIYLKTVLSELQKPGKKPLFLSNLTPAHHFDAREEIPVSPAQRHPLPNYTLPPKKSVLSATQLDSYASCPTQYLVRHRLKLRPIKSLEEQYPLIFGTAVHSALEQYFKQKEFNLTDLFIQSLDATSDKLRSHPFLFKQMLHHFESIKTHFLDLETLLTNRFGFTSNESLEKPFECKIEGYVFSGKIDRVIETLHKTLLLIDYKTGTVDFSPSHIPAGKNSQALLYILATRERTQTPCVGILYYDLKEGQLKKGLLNEDLLDPSVKKELTRGHAVSTEKFDALISEGKLQLLKLSSAIERGNFDPTPKASECSRCEAATFCRQGIGYV